MSFHLKKVMAGSLSVLLGLFISGGSVWAQNRTITGTVTDDFGEPLIGASVVVEGDTSTGAITDLDGRYTITVPAAAEALRFSYIGQKDAVETIGGRSVIDVTLTSDNIALNATVVTAMGIRKEEKSLSYNVQQPKLEGVSPVGSFVNGLNGKVAGVSISQSSTGAGGASRIVMRGSKSISNNNNALYVIDGIPMQSLRGTQPEGVYAGAGQTGDVLGSLNQDDIESISVLSGPSAAALYGASAANGVIIITTKKGQKDRLDIDYSNTTIFSRAYVMPQFQNTYGPSSPGSYYSWGAKLDTPSSYNPRDFFQTGVNEQNSFSLSSGTERSQTYVSAAVAQARGIIHNNNVGRYNLSFRNTTDLVKDLLSLDVNVTYGRVNEQNMIAQGEYGNPVVPVYLFPPGDDFSKVQVYERYDAGRNFKTQFWPYDFIQSMQNPYWITEHQKWQNAKTRLMGSAQLSYKPLKWLTLSARAKYDRTDEKQEQKFDASTNTLFTEGSKHGKYGLNNQYTEQKFAEVLATFNKYFGDNVINVTGVVGANIDDVTFRTDYINGPLAQVNNKFDLNNIDRNNSHTNLGTDGWRYQNQSVFANAQVGWRSRIYLDMTYRVDWNSTLWAAGAIPYPTVGLSGILTELIPGLKSSFFPYWKVRASYSEVGNTPNPADYVLDPRYKQTNGNILTDIRRRNKDLDPERTKSWEVGTNIHFFDSKLQIDATWYNANTFNQFYTARLSSTSTNSEMILNGGQVNNRGVELSVRFDDNAGKFNYGTYLTWTWNRNKIVDLSFVDPIDKQVYGRDGISVGGFGGVHNVLYEGGSLGDVYVTTIATDEHGFYRLNNDGMIIPDYDEDHMIFAGSTDARHRLSWGGHLGYGGFTAGFLFTARLGGVAISKTQAVMDYYGVSQDTADAREKGWFEFNGMKTSDVQGYYQVLGRDSGVMSQYVYDATNVRLAEVSLGYDFPVKNWGWVRGLNLSVIGNNLAMLFLKAPFDPEMTSSAGTYNQGIDYFMQPSTRSLGFSVKFRFGGSTAAKAAPAAAPVYVPSEPKVVEKVVEKIVEKVVEKEVVKEVPVPAGNAVTAYADDLFFIIGKSEIRPEEAFKLGRICQVLAENPDAKITVTGYADSGTGNDRINTELSEQRARKVVDMLVDAGISRDRISSSSVAGDRDASQSPESNRVAVCVVK